MIRLPPRSTRTDTLFPYTTRFRALGIRFGVLSVSTVLIGVLGKAGIGLYFVVAFLLLWAYPVVFAAMFNGQTPGKRAMELRVVSADGAPVGWLASNVRNLLSAVDALPVDEGLGLVGRLAEPP